MHDGAAISDALTDPEMFGPHFRGTSWNAWRAFVAALFAAPMTTEQVALFRLYTGRTTAPATPFTEAALIVGRRGGKSRVLAFVAVALAVLRSYDEHLAAGEVATIGVLAQTQKQGRSIFRFVQGLLREIPSLRPMILDETQDTILLSNRVQIEIAAASFRSTRGYSYAAVLADEVAFWRSEESLNPDTEILRALRPGMASIPGSVLMLASSPYGKKGALYNSFRRHYGKDDARVLVWKAPTEAMNPRIDPAIIAEAYEEDPEAARAEYGAEFRDDLADFITREAIDAITMWGRHELPPEPGAEHQAFVDPSGGASDSFTLAIGHQAGDIGILDALLEIRPPFDPDVAVAECAALLKRYGITRIVGDHYAGLWPVARFAAHGITFEQSARGKSDIYADFLPLANAGRVELLDHKRLASQFVGLERRTGRSGKDSIAEPKGAHDDCANAAAGVLVGLDLDRRPAMVRSGDLLTGHAALPLPTVCKGIFATLAVSRQGIVAVIFCAMTFDDTMVVLDYDAGPLTGGLFSGIATRLAELATAIRAQRGGVLFVQPDLVRPAQVAGYFVHEIPEHLQLSDLLLLPAAAHIAAGRVKLCLPAHLKAQTSAFGGALDFRGGDDGDDPLRRAALWAITLALDPPP
ncbi:hypothetical protein [Rhodopila sp.]|uniref:hypothetical protein n=1 Tax=Rhodopila sp. TaxID=2480087 RepID=UPI003D0C3CD7